MKQEIEEAHIQGFFIGWFALVIFLQIIGGA